MGDEELSKTAALKSDVQDVNLLRFVLFANILQSAQTILHFKRSTVNQTPLSQDLKG